MEENYDPSENEDELVFEEESDYSHDLSTESDSESDFIGQRRKKSRVLEISSSSSSMSDVDDSQEEEWIDMADEDDLETITFNIGSQITGPIVSSSIKEPIQFFNLFFTLELATEIVKEFNDYARTKLQNKTLSAYSFWQNWRDIELKEFWAFFRSSTEHGNNAFAEHARILEH